MQKFTINIDNAGARLDKFLAKNGCGFALAQKLLRQKKIKVNGANAQADYKLNQDDEIIIFGDFKTTNKQTTIHKIDEAKLNLIKKSIIYQDDNLLAIDKPAGIAVQSGNKNDFSIDAALPYLKLEKDETPRLVHRLDRDTSGILLLARNRKTAALLTDGFKNKTIKKTYLALVKGTLKKSADIISIPLIEKTFGQSKKVFKDTVSGKEAITHYQVLENFGDHSLVELKPITGRMHQLRVHCKEIGHPIIGDRKYGFERKKNSKAVFSEKGLERSETEGGTLKSNRLCLHSFKIEIADFFGKKLEIVSSKPDFI